MTETPASLFHTTKAGTVTALGKAIDPLVRGDVHWWIVCCMILSGLVHIPFFVSGTLEWEDPVSFRKPILFGISTGLTLASMLWVMGKLNLGRWATRLRGAITWSLAIEVALITMQAWRGVRSHFNTDGWFNTAVDGGMLVMITIASAVILILAWRSWMQFSKPSASPMQSAIWHGLNLLVISVVIGYVITGIGKLLSWNGLPPEIVPPGGVLKFPHGAGLHAIQALPFLAWITTLVPNTTPRQAVSHQAVRWGAATYYCCLAFAIEQTVRGRARFELDALGAILVGSALAAGSVCGIYVLRSFLSTYRRGQTSPASRSPS